MNIKAVLAIFGVFFGCCLNVVFVELLVRHDPGSGNLITFSQFFFIACHGLFFTSKCFTVKPSIAMKNYLLLVTMFFVSSVGSYSVFKFNISMPLNMIFRAGSLAANMILGILILKKSYTKMKYTSVLMITIGIIIVTISTGQHLKDTKKADQDPDELFWWSIGVVILTVAVFFAAGVGVFQEVFYKKHGKHPQEALFFTHAIPLPGFFLLFDDIGDHLSIILQSEPWSVLEVNIPKQLIFLIGNMLTQYLCISSVFVLTTECSSLTVTFVVTLRKFASLVFSVLCFKNAFTFNHWIGTTFVFIGTIIFVEIVPKVRESCKNSSANENDFEKDPLLSSGSIIPMTRIPDKQKPIEMTFPKLMSKLHDKYQVLKQKE